MIVEAPAPAALNLMESAPAAPPSKLPPGAAWFNDARFGMFIHYGLYSMLGRGEWAMHWDKIPPAEYNRLADKFTAENFDADALVDLARRAGARYVVFGARHHEGFCLWDTATTDFNTVRTAARRDLIREYTDACRRAGLRVGIYYSVMSWQWSAIHVPPAQAPGEWRRMVAETHAQVRELLTDYGHIDYLWYDGCVVPGLGDPGIRARVWRSRELNAMCRRLQPGILINDRAGTFEDITTPEQNLTPAAPGRLWEACMTIGDHWGWRPDDERLKSSAELIRNLIHCARHGGNFLLNVGPCPDGVVPPGQVERMEAIGRWLLRNGEAIHGSERGPYTEAEHVAGPATARGRRLYFHLSDSTEASFRAAGIRANITAARLLSDGRRLGVEPAADGTVLVKGLPTELRTEGPAVVAIELDAPAPRTPPPALLVERDTGRHAPAEAPVHAVEPESGSGRPALSFSAPVAGLYTLELSVVAAHPAEVSLVLDAGRVQRTTSVECGGYPVTLRLPGIVLAEGPHALELQARDASPLVLSRWRLQPHWRVLEAGHWQTAGPFPVSFSAAGGTDEQVRATMIAAFPPEQDANAVAWRDHPGAVGEEINFAAMCDCDIPGLYYARTVIVSPVARFADVLLGCDWWANLYVNGELVATQRDPAAVAADGAHFNGWKPAPARVALRRGENVLLVKAHPGSTDNWFSFRVNDSGDLGFFRQQ